MVKALLLELLLLLAPPPLLLLLLLLEQGGGRPAGAQVLRAKQLVVLVDAEAVGHRPRQQGVLLDDLAAAPSPNPSSPSSQATRP